jgi:sugar phosphate permease
MNQNPATHVRHQVIGVSMLMAFILYLDRLCLANIVASDSFASSVNLNPEEKGRVLGAFFFSYALFQVPSGWASDRWGPRRMLTLYIVLWSVFTGLTGLMSSYVTLLTMRLLCGMAEAGAYPTSAAVIRRWVPERARGSASALVATGGRIGGTLAPVITAWMVLKLGSWRTTMWIDAAVGLVVAGLYWLMVRDRPSQHPRCNAAEQAFIGTPVSEPALKPRDFVTAVAAFMGSGSLWLNSLMQLFTNVGWVFLATWLPTYLKESKGLTEQRIGTLTTLIFAAGMVGQFLGGFFADWSDRVLGRRWGRVFPMAVGGFVSTVAYLVCMGIDSVWGVVICCAVVSFSVDLSNPAGWAFMQDVGGRVTGAALGWGNMWGNLGAAASSAWLIPKLMLLGGQGGGQTAVFLMCAGAMFLSGVLTLGMDATKPLLREPAARPA